MEKCFRCVSLHLQQAWKNKWITNKWQVFFLTKKDNNIISPYNYMYYLGYIAGCGIEKLPVG